MLKRKIVKKGLMAAAVTSALAVASMSQAAITDFTDDFQSVGDDGFTGWQVFSDNAGFVGGAYFFTPASSVGPQISALADDGLGNDFMNFFANYDNTNVHDRNACAPCSPNLQESISVFHEMSFTGADTAAGDTWNFEFDYQLGTPGPDGDTEVGAFIRVFDPAFNLLGGDTLDTSGASATFQSGLLSVTLDPGWGNGLVQIGFNNLVGGFDDSGMGYDNVNFYNASEVPIPAAAWLFGSALMGLVGISRRRKS